MPTSSFESASGESMIATRIFPKREWFLWLFLIAAAIFHTLPFEFLQREAIYVYDDTIYLAGARSLADGHGYRYATFFQEPKIGFYPPLQSWLMSWVFRWNPDFPANLLWLNLQSVLCALLGYAAAWTLWRHWNVPIGLRMLWLGAWMVSPTWNTILYGLMADVGFGALCAWILTRWTRTSESNPSSKWWVTAIGLAIAYLWRTAALGLMVGFLASTTWTTWRDKRWERLMVASCILGVTLVGWRFAAQGASGYAYMLKRMIQDLGGTGGYLKLMGKNLELCLQGLPLFDTIFCGFVRLPEIAARHGEAARSTAVSFSVVAFVATSALAMRGFWSRRSPLQWSLLMLSILYFGQMVPMPFSAWHFHRYTFVFLPLFLVWIWWGWLSLSQRSQSWLSIPMILFLIVNLLSNVWFLRAHFRMRADVATRETQDIREIGHWLAKNSDTNARIGVNYGIPHQQLWNFARRPMVVDFLISQDPWVAMQPEDQGNPQPQFVVSRTAPELHRMTKFSAQEVLRSANGVFRLFRISPY